MYMKVSSKHFYCGIILKRLQTRKNPTCSSTVERKKLQYIYYNEMYIAVRMEKKTRTTLKIWFNLTNIILGEIIQTQKRIHFIKFEKNKSYLCCFKSGISYLHREISDCKWLQWGFGGADNVLCLDLSEKSLASLQKCYQSNTVNERIYTTTVFSRIHLLTQ